MASVAFNLKNQNQKEKSKIMDIRSTNFFHKFWNSITYFVSLSSIFSFNRKKGERERERKLKKNSKLTFIYYVLLNVIFLFKAIEKIKLFFCLDFNVDLEVKKRLLFRLDFMG